MKLEQTSRPMRRRTFVSVLSLLTLALCALLSAPLQASPGSADDAATIKASNDDIYRVRVIKLYDPEGKTGEVQVAVETVLRGDSAKTNRTLNLVWDTDYPKKNQNWVVMVSTGEDGALHVNPEIRYDISEERVGEEGKEQWIQQTVLKE